MESGLEYSSRGRGSEMQAIQKQRLAAALAGALLVLCATTAPVNAQSTNSADIRGTVSDATGAVIPAATVNILNVENGVSKEILTNEAGIYDAVSVLPGKYKLTFSKSGFGNLVRDGVTLDVGVMSVDAQLSLGNSQQLVQVTAEAPLLKTETGEQSATLRADNMAQLPNVGQDWQNL